MAIQSKLFNPAQQRGRSEMKALTTLWVVCMFAMTVAMADDVDDVKVAVLGYSAAISAGDANSQTRYHMPEYTSFGPGGGLLEREYSLEEQRNRFQPAYDAGQRLNLQVRHLEVRVYGNAAIVTSYVVGTIRNTDGTTIQSRDQRSAMWIKQGGQWREAHRHNSPY